MTLYISQYIFATSQIKVSVHVTVYPNQSACFSFPSQNPPLNPWNLQSTAVRALNVLAPIASPAAAFSSVAGGTLVGHIGTMHKSTNQLGDIRLIRGQGVRLDRVYPAVRFAVGSVPEGTQRRKRVRR